jgi:two-component system, OmpR family, response regulator
MKVLLIDNDESITEAVSFYLETLGILCKVENDGKKGLDYIRNNNRNGVYFDTILLDLAMPVFSGYDIFTILKGEGLLKSNRVILFTASILPDDKIQNMLADGVKGVLRKPFSLEELESAIRVP